VQSRLASALAEIDLRIESEAKQELRPGKGVVTGTLRRSIHAASPSYNWENDNVEPGADTPERGGQEVQPEISKAGITGSVGSGLEYAMAVHQGHHNFEGYHYLTNALQKVMPKVKGIVERRLK
jgi:hypothetical protein